MLAVLNNIKPTVLALSIAVGLSLHCSPSEAASSETAVFAGGCFWCVESDFESVPGVKEVISGFTGGTVPDPSYKQVVRGGTGHYEAVQIVYDPAKVSYARLVELFFRSVDPTDAGGQFCDRGNTYRTAIFATPGQTSDANAGKSDAQDDLGKLIVTPVLAAQTFYPADAYHQDYYRSDDLILTRFGPKRKSVAYKLYREGCGRDERITELWGNTAPFVGH